MRMRVTYVLILVDNFVMGSLQLGFIAFILLFRFTISSLRHLAVLADYHLPFDLHLCQCSLSSGFGTDDFDRLRTDGNEMSTAGLQDFYSLCRR